jgi:hypothetical protein
MAFLPGDKLAIADKKASQVILFDLADLTAIRKGAFGAKAKPGEAAPDRFHALFDIASGSDGTLVSVQRLPLGGSRLTRWKLAANTWKPVWDHMGLEFTGNANYASERPDQVMSTYMHSYTVSRKGDTWKYNGNGYTGGNFNRQHWHGAPRWVKLGQKWFFFLANDDGMQVYRQDGAAMHMATLVGGQYPGPKGENTEKLGQWTWSDSDNDSQVQDAEVTWFKQPGEGRYNVMGMNVDARGNIIFCDQNTRSIQILPMLGLNARGNPIYDWSKSKEIAPADDSKDKFFPIMAVRSERQQVYAFGRSDAFAPFPGSGPAWMGGWTLAKFDKTGKRLWITRLPGHVTGMDIIPGRKAGDLDAGVVAGQFSTAEIYHITPDGIVVGSVKPGKPAGGVSGWLDNTASVAANRDPRDGLIDVFAEEDYAHHILWHRIDDSTIDVLKKRFTYPAASAPETP